MNCTQCQQPLKDGALYCEHCGHQFAVEEQRQKVYAARAKTKGVLAAQFHSVLFLVLTICYTVTLATQAGSLLTGGIAGILPFIFMLISMIGMCGFRLVWLAIVMPIFRDFRVVSICYVVSWILTASTYLIYVKKSMN